MIDLNRLRYIKNVNDDHGWAYKDYPLGAYFPLHFSRLANGVDDHALNLPKGSLIILSQRPPAAKDRYLTHIVELVNDGNEDKPQWTDHQYGIIRWVKVHWAADFSNPSNIPLDKNLMQVDWGWSNTIAKSLESPNLMSQWHDIETLRTHLGKELN